LIQKLLHSIIQKFFLQSLGSIGIIISGWLAHAFSKGYGGLVSIGLGTLLLVARKLDTFTIEVYLAPVDVLFAIQLR
jgi:hypothetical protein